MPTKTIEKKGGKSIIIKTQELEKYRISVILCITVDGGKLPPYLIFKAGSDGRIGKDLKKDPNVLNKRCIASCNDNSWATDKIINDWFYKVWFPHLKKENKYILWWNCRTFNISSRY